QRRAWSHQEPRTMSARRCRSLGACAFLLATLAASPPEAAVQQKGNLSLDQFQPAPAGDRFFGVQSPEAEGHAQLKLMLLGEYAHDLLVLVHENSGDDAGTVVGDQLFLHVGGALPLWNRLLL